MLARFSDVDQHLRSSHYLAALIERRKNTHTHSAKAHSRTHTLKYKMKSKELINLMRINLALDS